MDSADKKRLYLGLWLVLGGFAGLLSGELLEWYSLGLHNEVLENKSLSYAILILVGVGIGIWVGPIAWKKIYVDGVRGKKYVVKKTAKK